jgi:hypothetical protein
MKTRYMVLLVLFFCYPSLIMRAGELLTTKRQTFDAAGVTRAHFDAGAGKLSITGIKGGSSIEVVAEFRGEAGSKQDQQKILDNLRLTMETQGHTFYLKSESVGDWHWGNRGMIELTVTLPSRLALDVEDGSGSMVVSAIDSDVSIKDGSGEIELDGVRGNLRIDDGSGSMVIRDVGGSVDITDGSGSVDIVRVGGDVQITDGSGSIDVRDVEGRFEVEGGGSGSIHFKGVRGEVRIPHRKRDRQTN